jgi:Raf kinase inhibitor-like YbhB/YbcL family protein
MKQNVVRLVIFIMAVVFCISAAALAPSGAGDDRIPIKKRKKSMNWKIESSAFKQGEKIPVKYTCSGPDVSPPLTWSAAPDKTAELVIIMDDPDAPVGTWTHWLLYGLDAKLTGLPENVSKGAEAKEISARQGVTSFKRSGYGGPCPPPGKPHRYFFKLYALNEKTNLPPGATRDQIKDAMKGHIIAETQLMGLFGR